MSHKGQHLLLTDFKLFYLSHILFADISFTSHQDAGCLHGNNLHVMEGDPASDHQPCKDYCASRGDCGGFALGATFGRCYFKGLECENDMNANPTAVLFLKKIS